jgi:hypothetical protein
LGPEGLRAYNSSRLTGCRLQVKRAVLGPFMAQEEDDVAVGTGKTEGGAWMMAVGRPLPINLDLLTHSAKVAVRQGNSSLAQLIYLQCTQVSNR